MNQEAKIQELLANKSKTVSAKAVSPSILSAIQEYNSSLHPSHKREENIKALEEGNTVVIVTGQQAGLFGGPVFTLYKILTAVKTAQLVEEKTGIKAVPLFWVQSEDHDLEEINSFQAPVSDVLSEFKIPLEGTNTNKKSVSHIKVSNGVLKTLSEIHSKFSTLPEQENTLELLKKHYTSDNTFPSAFTSFLAELLSKYGIVFFDPNHPKAKESFSKYFEQVLEQHINISNTLLSRSEELKEQGLSEQVHIRENSPLFFVHEESSSGPRFRITLDGNKWNSLGSDSSYNSKELIDIVRNSPERISTSALLRPIIQDSLFPTLAYVGGEAEIAYHKQIKPLYSLFDLEQPIILPRAHFTITEEKDRRLLSKLDIPSTSLKESKEDILKSIAEKNLSQRQKPSQLKQELLLTVNNKLKSLESVFLDTDKTLVPALNNATKKINHQVESLIDRYAKALARNDETNLARVEKLKSRLYPDNKPQERVFGLAFYLSTYGNTFIDNVFDSIVVGEETFKEIEL